ncbi:MAG TPA: ROK family transcriptional regulator [Firmicutes bacterium]|nr:ROK family transcriptional regulator [Bacillota bacterium]
MGRIKADLLYMKELNRRLILDTIRQHGEISRAEIAKTTKLNPSTVTRIIADLIEEGFVRETGYADSHGGRKPILVDLVPDAAFIIGINVETNLVIGIVSNLVGDIIYNIHLPLPSHSKEDVLGAIIRAVDWLLDQAAGSDQEIIGIGVAMHGLVDSAKGIALFPPAFGWKDLPLGELLEKRFNMPVRLENNARAMALGEWWFGAGRNSTNFIALKVGYGIGSGIILNGQIFRGVDFTAGEIGHTTVTIDGPLCDCGNYGCLEALASVNALVRNAARALKSGQDSKILELAGAADAVQPQHIFTAAAQNDPLAIRLLQETGRYLGIALASLTNVLNPTKILIGGDLAPALDFILPTLTETVQTRAMEIPAQRLEIRGVELGEYSPAIGAVTLILEDMFKPIS